MLEKDLNGIIRKSFAEQGDFAFKIQDSGQYFNGKVSHTKNPADGIAFYKGYFVAWESKWLPKPSSLNLQRLQDHQLDFLKKTKNCLKSSKALFLVGIKWTSRETRVYIFEDIDELERRRNSKENILKKEFETMENYVSVKKGIINIEELFSKSKKEKED